MALNSLGVVHIRGLAKSAFNINACIAGSVIGPISARACTRK